MTRDELERLWADHLAGEFEFAQAQVDALGAWTLDIRGVTGNENPTTLAVRPTRVRATSSLTGSGTVTLTIR